jgi:hypothetical protein
MFTEEGKAGFHMPFCHEMDVLKILYQNMYIPKEKTKHCMVFSSLLGKITILQPNGNLIFAAIL